ncbi:MAG: O-methyltransferase [Maricaulaceae bacterium]
MSAPSNGVLGAPLDKAKLHAGGAAAWDSQAATLALIAETVQPGMATFETGAGQSTLAFARAGARHQCVTPSGEEIARVRAAMDDAGLEAASVAFHEGFSQDVLPHLTLDPLDVVLVDGGHGFPIPAVDWLFLAPHLKVGGLLILDDVDLWTGAMIVDVLKAEPGWRHQTTLRGRTAVFELTAPFVPREWTNQPYVRRRSFWPQLRRKATNALGLAMRGDFKGLVDKARNEQALAAAAKHDL